LAASAADVGGEQVEQGLGASGRRARGGDDRADVAAQRRRDADSEPPEVLLGLQDRFDTHFLDSPPGSALAAAA